MRIICFGGTFDPPHNGHELLIREALAADLGDLVAVIPVNQPAHKQIASSSEPADRLEMAVRAFGSIKQCIVDGREIERGGVSYTYETVLELERQYRPTEKISVIAGYDLVSGFPSWKNWEKLKQRVRFIIAGRDSDELNVSSLSGCDWVFLDNPRLDVSSRMIREKCAAGEEISEYVSPEVAWYIKSRGLYGAQGSG